METWTPEVIVSVIVQISLAIGTIGSLIIGIGSAIESARRSKSDVEMTHSSVEMQEVEVTGRLQQIAKGLVEDMRYELDIWKGKVLEIDEQLQVEKEASRRFKYCMIEIIKVANKVISKSDESTIGEVRTELTELELILNQISHELNI